MLTAREYTLVEYLARHRGALVTRTGLYEHLFDENDATLSNLLDVHVSNVRKKLGHDFIVTRTWTISDSCGNPATPVVQVITVDDTIGPIITPAPADTRRGRRGCPRACA